MNSSIQPSTLLVVFWGVRRRENEPMETGSGADHHHRIVIAIATVLARVDETTPSTLCTPTTSERKRSVAPSASAAAMRLCAARAGSSTTPRQESGKRGAIHVARPRTPHPPPALAVDAARCRSPETSPRVQLRRVSGRECWPGRKERTPWSTGHRVIRVPECPSGESSPSRPGRPVRAFPPS